ASVDYTAPGWAEKVKELTGGRGVDIVLETAGGDTVHQAISAMAPFGRMIFLGQSSGQTSLIDPWELTVANHTMTSFYVGGYLAYPDLIQSTLGEVLGFIMTGKLSLQVGTVLPLSQMAEAHRQLEGRQTTGKVVVQPWVDA
ncbi:MAG TPA: zinc-binding dehydrogenase, partial [Phenylobacterium sp.]